MSALPIHAVLPDLLSALRGGIAAVLIAPPGAGKTTAVAPALLMEEWCSGTVIVLSPRRVAARAAAERMAELLGERPGETIGYLTRMDSKHSAKTRVLVMTEAIFVSALVADPELAGVSAVLFDEAHERHLDSDLGLALAIESQQVLRPDLRLVVMSATIDGARFATLLNDAPVIESAGKAWPLTLRWLDARPELKLPEAAAQAIMTAWREQTGDILAFLPGVGEIERTRENLALRLPTALILPLHGQCEPADQRRAIRRDQEGQRRIVLATAIAESSLTLDGVSVVVDAGLSRRAEYDKASGVTRLVTQRASQAAAAQRAGRAARQGPGTAYRMWSEAGHAGRAAYDPPELLVADLTALVLTLAQWGARDPAELPWLDPPPAAAVRAAIAQLQGFAALDEAGAITQHGRSIAALAMAPQQAQMLLYAAQHGGARDAAMLALLLQERGLGGRGDDLALRLDRWRTDRTSRADASRQLARRWERAALELVEPDVAGTASPPLGIVLAAAYPGNVARRRDGLGEFWLTADGRGLRLDLASPLVTSEWLAVGDAQGDAKGARITGAIALTTAEVERWLEPRLERKATLRWIADEQRVEALRETRLGAITLSQGPDPAPDPAAIRAFLIAKVRSEGFGLVPFSAASLNLLRRAKFAGIAALAEEELLGEAEQWLGPLLGRRFDQLHPGQLHTALRDRLDYAAKQQLERLAPAQFVSPAGTEHQIDYDDPGGPSVELRAQALFGLDRHPQFGQPPQPLLLKLTSPGGKPVQTTRDLPGFWRGSWRDVQRDMKGRYPKHRWPDEPWLELPSLKTKNAFNRT